MLAGAETALPGRASCVAPAKLADDGPTGLVHQPIALLECAVLSPAGGQLGALTDDTATQSTEDPAQHIRWGRQLDRRLVDVVAPPEVIQHQAQFIAVLSAESIGCAVVAVGSRQPYVADAAQAIEDLVVE